MIYWEDGDLGEGKTFLFKINSKEVDYKVYTEKEDESEISIIAAFKTSNYATSYNSDLSLTEIYQKEIKKLNMRLDHWKKYNDKVNYSSRKGMKELISILEKEIQKNTQISFNF